MGEYEPGHCSQRTLVNFDPEGVGDRKFYDSVPDGEAWQFQGFDGNVLPRSLNGRITDGCTSSVGLPCVSISASTSIRSCRDRVQKNYVGDDGGYMIPIHSKIGQIMRIHFEKLLNEYGMNDLIPVYL